MFPTIPENLNSLSAAEARTLAGELRVAAEAVRNNPDSTPEEVDLAIKAVAARKEILAFAANKEALVSAELSEDEEAEPAAADDEAADDTDDGDDASDADDADDAGEHADTSDKELSAKSKLPAKKVRTTTGVSTEASTDGAGRFTPDKLIATDAVPGVSAGSPFESWRDLAESLVEVGSSLNPSSSQQFTVAKVPGNFGEGQLLGPNMLDNLRMFEPEIMAEMCAPAEPQYDLACWNTDRRPVRGSMRAYKPDARGAVSIYPSPSLADITDQDVGFGVWTKEDDQSLATTDPSSKECAVIECAEPATYRLYGVWRCLTVQNLLAMTFPELVEAYLNRLAAAHSRLAETRLLEAMGTSATPVSQSDLGYGSTVSITSTVLNMLALHQEEERWDLGEADAWLPRWVRYAMKMDIIRRRSTNGGMISVPSDAQIDNMFRDVGVEPHFFIDTPTWAEAVPAVQTGGVLNLLPSTIDMVIAPRGKFAVMDRGELSIGVTGNNIYRDNASNSKNQFTMFFENFESLVDTNSCPAYLLTIEDLCHNGIQIADEVMACDGGSAGS